MGACCSHHSNPANELFIKPQELKGEGQFIEFLSDKERSEYEKSAVVI